MAGMALNLPLPFAAGSVALDPICRSRCRFKALGQAHLRPLGRLHSCV